MRPGEIQTLYAYNTWANTRILDTAARLSADELTAEAGINFPSVLATLVHIYGAQALYLARCQGDDPATMPDSGRIPDLATLRDAWNQCDDAMHRFLDSLSKADLDRAVRYTNAGGTWLYPLWQILVHQVNHATQHRSEAAVALTRLGHSPGWLDFLIFIDEQEF